MLWLGCGGSIRENPVPNLDCDSAQATGEVRLTPNFANHLVMLFKYGLHQKSHIPGLLLGQPPLKFCNRIIRPNLFNTVKYALNTIRRITRIRRMTHPCLLFVVFAGAQGLQAVADLNAQPGLPGGHFARWYQDDAGTSQGPKVQFA